MTQDPVITALEQQVGCYRRLAKLAELQHEHVQRSQTEELLEVLKDRQAVLNQATSFEQTMAPAKRQWAGYLNGLDIGARTMAEALLAETRRLLEQITAADNDDALVLQQRKLNRGRQISQAPSARQVNRNYAASAYAQRASRVEVLQSS